MRLPTDQVEEYFRGHRTKNAFRRRFKLCSKTASTSKSFCSKTPRRRFYNKFSSKAFRTSRSTVVSGCCIICNNHSPSSKIFFYRLILFIQLSFIITSARYLSLLQCRSATPSSIKLAYGDV